MFRSSTRCLRPAILAGLALVCLSTAALPQERRARIRVENYNIDAEIQPATQALIATAEVRFVPLDNNVSAASFELNNALNVSKVVDGKGAVINDTRNTQDFTVRLSFDPPLPKGQPATAKFIYEGRLGGSEDSPVYGIKFAAIHPDYAFLLYPARWFPINGYTTDRFTADLHITVPSGFQVLGSGLDTHQENAGKVVYSFHFDHPSFPGSIAVVHDPGAKVSSEGVTTTLYFRDDEKSMAQQYGDTLGQMMSLFTGDFGLPPVANLAVVETEAGAPNGYAAPGLIFLNPHAIGHQVGTKLLANQISRQWWEVLVSPATRNHLWLTNGLAAYSEMLWTEHTAGPGALEAQFRDDAVEALTVDNVPIIQSARMEDYSPELWALSGSKGAAVLHMLRFVIGDQAFMQTLKEYATRYSWKSANTEDFKNVAQNVSKQDLGYFFIQWIESSGAPEFKLEYTIYRTQKGFRVMGKVAQDLDTFRMPVDLKIETEGNPEEKRVEVVGTSSEFTVDCFGKPKNVIIDPDRRLLRYSNQVRTAVAIRRGEQFMEVGEFADALKEYQKALENNRNSSMAHYRIAEVYFQQNNYQSAANEFRDALNDDLEPKWIEVWARIHLGMIFDISGQRDRAVNQYNLAVRTKDNTQNAQEEAAKYLKKPYERKKSPEAEQ
ncbi:MAG TPA: M1 family aminopeptidase [Bryobacteraceae bacterium]|jgi:tetratricopeptide (TPR) repeat protein|nr:M1 family aminopeptidase [Bryobacteraceae bacterium]